MALPKVQTPTFQLDLPSNGQKVTFRPYLVKEEKILMLALESDDNSSMIRAIKDVIESCTYNELNEKNITMFDLEYFFINLRAKSVGENSQVIVPCPSCGEQNTVDIDLSNVFVNVPSDKNYYIRKVNDEISVRMTYPTVEQTIALTDDSKSDIDLAYDVIFASIAEIYHNDEVYDANDHTHDELVEFIESLDSSQFENIKDFVEDMPSAMVTYQHMCPSCGYNEERVLDGLANFFG
mgnify:CR=1 FL=1